MLYIAVFSGLLAVMLGAGWARQHRDPRGRHVALVPVRTYVRHEGPRPAPRHAA